MVSRITSSVYPLINPLLIGFINEEQAMNYWEQVRQARVSRRRGIAVMAGAGVGGALLAACGSSDSGGGTSSTNASSTGDKSGLVYQPSESKPKPGGTLKHYVTADILHFDALADPSASTVANSSEPFYPRLLRFKTFKHPQAADGSSEGEVAQSWEMTPDRLQLTLKVRPGMKWDARAPTNGRVLDANDIVFSWNKFRTVNSAAAAIVYNANTAPEAPIASLTATDASTIVIKLQQPNASLLPLLSARDIFYVGPKEMDGGFEPKTTVRGHGPFILDEYVPASRFVWKKNPDYYQKDVGPNLERVEIPIISDNAQRQAQFRAGNVFTDVLAASPDQIVAMKKALPQTVLLQEASFLPTPSPIMTFGWESGSQFKDQRLRQALSMLIDRETYIDVLDNRENFRKDGLEVPVAINTVIPAGWGDYWLDPTKQREFGPNAIYLSHNVAEAKKLIAAAGFPNGFEFDFNFASGGQYGALYDRQVQVFAGMFDAGGLKTKQTGVPTASVWLDQYSRGYRSKEYAAGQKKGFNGIALVPERTYPTAAVHAYNQLHKDGQGYRGMVPAGGNVVNGDPQANDMAMRITQEFDRNKQIAVMHDLIRYVTGQSYYIPRVSGVKGYSLWWPVVGNLGAFVSYPGSGVWTDQRLSWWIDDSKPPIKPS
jgi:peptide/nickel transport system substrate-binding protein